LHFFPGTRPARPLAPAEPARLFSGLWFGVGLRWKVGKIDRSSQLSNSHPPFPCFVVSCSLSFPLVLAGEVDGGVSFPLVASAVLLFSLSAAFPLDCFRCYPFVVVKND